LLPRQKSNKPFDNVESFHSHLHWEKSFVDLFSIEKMSKEIKAVGRALVIYTYLHTAGVVAHKSEKFIKHIFND